MHYNKINIDEIALQDMLENNKTKELLTYICPCIIQTNSRNINSSYGNIHDMKYLLVLQLIFIIVIPLQMKSNIDFCKSHIPFLI